MATGTIDTVEACEAELRETEAKAAGASGSDLGMLGASVVGLRLKLASLQAAAAESAHQAALAAQAALQRDRAAKVAALRDDAQRVTAGWEKWLVDVAAVDKMAGELWPRMRQLEEQARTIRTTAAGLGVDVACDIGALTPAVQEVRDGRSNLKSWRER